MKTKIIIVFIVIISSFFSQRLYSSGNLNNLELGTAIYRELDTKIIFDGVYQNHWHTALFNYFEYINGTGYIWYTEARGLGDHSTNDYASYTITISNYMNDLNTLKSKFFEKFLHNYKYDYYGAYSRIILPNTRSDIVLTAYQLGVEEISYTWDDMLDCYSDNWNGKISDISDIRCDGIVEYSYEKNNILVSNVYNISQPGIVNLYYHNDFHNLWYDEGELCPRIQAGESHSGSGTNHSLFDPLISNTPSIIDFSATQPNKIQLYFVIEDDASVKSYLLIQVKKISEDNWHVLIDDQNQTWKFKSVDLTDYYKGKQRDYFHILWDGKYEGGHYPSGSQDFNLKVTVIDQGCNYFESVHNFSGTISYPSVNISGPTLLGYNEQGTFTANPSGGSGTYTNYRWWERKDEGGGGIDPSPITNQGDNLIDAPPQGEWIYRSGWEGQQTIQVARSYDFSLKCEVTDSYNNTATDIHSVVVGGALSKSQSVNNDEISTIALPKNVVLSDNYPNPFNPSTIICFGLPEDSNIKLSIYSINGQKVITLANGYFSKGYHEIRWNGKNPSGRLVANGLYIAELKTDNKRLIKKMIFAK